MYGRERRAWPGGGAGSATACRVEEALRLVYQASHPASLHARRGTKPLLPTAVARPKGPVGRTGDAARCGFSGGPCADHAFLSASAATFVLV
jgi:hypothetical protein